MLRVMLEETRLPMRTVWSTGEKVQDPAVQVCVEAQVVQLGGRFMGGGGWWMVLKAEL